MGNFSRGWDEYEWLLKTPELAGSVLPAGYGMAKTYVEKQYFCMQNRVDAIQFIRYAPLVASPRGAHLI
jgi:hypothetical protein